MILFAGGGRGPMSSFGNLIIFFLQVHGDKSRFVVFFSKVGVWNLKSKYINIDVHFCITKVKVFITTACTRQQFRLSMFLYRTESPLPYPTCLIYLIVVIIYILLSIFSTGLPPH